MSYFVVFVLFSFCSQMSFLDFIRVHRLPEEAARRQRNDIDLRQQQQQRQQQAQQQAQNQHPQPQAQPQQPVQPPPQQQPAQAAAPRREEIVRPLNGDQAGPALPEEPQAFDEGLPELLDGEGGDADLQGGVDNEFDAFENDLPPGEGEIQFALDELLGLRGITHLLRNAWLLLAFNCVYIGLFASFPYMVGVSICRFFGQSAWVKTMYSMLNWLVPQAIIFTSQVNTLSSASEDALQFSDMVLVVLGYASLFLMIFALSESLYTLREVFNPSFLTNSIVSLAAFANIVKVALLLFIRVFILPVILGIVVLVFANKFLGYGTNEWAIFVASNVVGSVSLSWVAGISYMVSTTLTVLQLREILHPDILARSIRPQEPHYQLLLSLMYESTFTHCRRVVTSMMVYLSLLVLCVYAPLYIARHTLGMHVTIASAVSVAEQSVTSDAATAGATSTIFPLYFNYFIPQIQIPFELAFAHLTFLTLLDRHKDKIGHALFFWLKTVGGALGLNRTLLPFAMIPYQAAQVDYPDMNHRMFHKDGRVYSANLDGPLVRGPMVRPPPRWDEQNGRNTARWAWGTEAKTHTELHVAPRTTPILWVPRLLLLAFVSWVVIGLMVIVGMFFPLGLGRTLLKLMQIPSWLMHDPFCYSLGAACTWVLFSLASTVNLGVLTPYIQACRKLSKSNMRLIVRVVLHWLIAELGVGMTIRACLIVTPLSQHWNWPSVSLILGTYLKGTFFASGFVGLIYYGYLERLLSFLDYKAPDVVTDDQGISITRLVENRDPTIQALSDWATALRETLQKPTLIYRGPNIWEVDIARVEQLRTLLVKPLYFKFFRRTVLYYLQLHAARFTVMFMGKSNVKIPYDIVLGVFDASEIDSWLVRCLQFANTLI